jgi:hypothetical protein
MQRERSQRFGPTQRRRAAQGWRSPVLVAAVSVMCAWAQPAQAHTAYAVTETDTLISFSTHTVSASIVAPMTGLRIGEKILALDVRPQDGRLYGASAWRLYKIDQSTAIATEVPARRFRRCSSIR